MRSVSLFFFNKISHLGTTLGQKLVTNILSLPDLIKTNTTVQTKCE